MTVINSEVEPGEEKVVNSRYSIVLATAKRARQIISGSKPLVDDDTNKKPLSIAVEELYDSQIKILTEEEQKEHELEAEAKRLSIKAKKEAKAAVQAEAETETLDAVTEAENETENEK